MELTSNSRYQIATESGEKLWFKVLDTLKNDIVLNNATRKVAETFVRKANSGTPVKTLLEPVKGSWSKL